MQMAAFFNSEFAHAPSESPARNRRPRVAGGRVDVLAVRPHPFEGTIGLKYINCVQPVEVPSEWAG